MNIETDISVWHRVCKSDALPVKEGRRVEFENYKVALFRLEDGYLAIDNACPHKQGPLADGIVAGSCVFCPLHGWKVDLKTGCALSGGDGQVKSYPVKVVNGDVYVAFEEGKLCSREGSTARAGQEIFED